MDEKPIILLSGGTGVGTSRLSLELAKNLDIPSVVGTDAVREVIRSIIAPGVNPVLQHSTYTAGQTKNYSAKEQSVRDAEILRAYKIQCTPVFLAIESIIERAVHENLPLIVEGVHIVPGRIRETNIYSTCQDRLTEYLIHIPDEQIHKKRFLQRQGDSPKRMQEKYLKNFKEIRLICDYLSKKADYNDVKKIDNSHDIRASIDEMFMFYYSQL